MRAPVSIVMPVYNEEEILETTVRAYHSEIIEAIPGSEFIIVDDCSTDKSPEILERIQKELTKIQLLRPKRNGGHGKAIRLGFENASCGLVFHTDSDHQFEPTDFWKLYDEHENNDLIIGYRANRKDPVHRIITTRILRIINLITFGFNIKDSNSPFKLINKKCLDECLKEISPEAFAPSILIALTAKWKGFKVHELPVEHMPRSTGKVSIAGLGFIRACITSFSDTINLKRSLGDGAKRDQ